MNRIFFSTLLFIILSLSSCSCDSAVVGTVESSTGSGKAGSMARFALTKNYLYTLNTFEMMLFNLDNPRAPSFYKSIYMDWDVETLFPYGEALFIGIAQGMMIYDVANPAFPKELSDFSHVQSCDPVVVDGNRAYVTLRSGNRCFGNVNELQIIDVTNYLQPKLIQTYQMENPHGLAIDNALLVICDGAAGVKCFDASDPYDIKLIQHIGDITSYDVILTEKTMIIIAEEGMIQYDRTKYPFEKLSTIPIG